ncbi:hypothetical protein, partial [Evansella vedderi]|uniref:hypothetical protein n=1 Tax=Evansella vedderi TaxID=38282 RepID=UPI0027D83B93
MRVPIEAATRALPIRTENALTDKKRFLLFIRAEIFSSRWRMKLDDYSATAIHIQKKYNFLVYEIIIYTQKVPMTMLRLKYL